MAPVYCDPVTPRACGLIPVEQITNVVSNVLYGIMVTNFFNGQPKPSDVQAKEILDVIFPQDRDRSTPNARRPLIQSV